MASEIQWRLREPERWIDADREWKRHSEVPPRDAPDLILAWNKYDKFFEYRINPEPKES